MKLKNICNVVDTLLKTHIKFIVIANKLLILIKFK